MQFFDARENASGEFSGESVRCMDSSLDAGQTRLQWICGIVLVSLLHAGLLAAYLQRTREQQTLAEPLPMEVALIAAPAPQPVKQAAPPAPPVVQPKPQPKPKPVKPKKAPAPVKKSSPATKAPAIAKPVSEPTPSAMSEHAAPTPASSPSTSMPATPPAPAAAKPKSETFTEANFRANYKSNPKPAYPRLAKSRGWQGKVLLRVKVTADGHGAEVSVQQSSGHDMLDEAAIEAVKNWTFIPAKRGDTPVASTVAVPITFKLND